MSSPADATESPVPHHSATADWSAMVFGIASAVGYSAANICLRQAAGMDPVWVSQLKSIPLVVLVGVLLAWRAGQGQAVGLPWPLLRLMVFAATVGQLGGNILFQWSLRAVGIALAVPVTTGTQIIGGAVLGYWFLGDRIAPRVVQAGGLLILAIGVLASGAAEAAQRTSAVVTPGSATSWQMIAIGVLAMCISGLSYSVLGVALRHATRAGAPIATLLFVSGLVGFVTLGAIVHARYGLQIWQDTRAIDYANLAAAGVFNVLAFAALTKALRLSSVAFVNALSASQIAIAAVAGVLLFREPFTYTLTLGVALTMWGLFWMRPRATKS